MLVLNAVIVIVLVNLDVFLYTATVPNVSLWVLNVVVVLFDVEKVVVVDLLVVVLVLYVVVVLVLVLNVVVVV